MRSRRGHAPTSLCVDPPKLQKRCDAGTASVSLSQQPVLITINTPILKAMRTDPILCTRTELWRAKRSNSRRSRSTRNSARTRGYAARARGEKGPLDRHMRSIGTTSKHSPHTHTHTHTHFPRGQGRDRYLAKAQRRAAAAAASDSSARTRRGSARSHPGSRRSASR